VSYLLAKAFSSEAVLVVLGGGNLLLVFVAATLGLVLGVVARKSGLWPIVGIVTSVLAPLLSLAALTIFFLVA